jgi:hypothetical protein
MNKKFGNERNKPESVETHIAIGKGKYHYRQYSHESAITSNGMKFDCMSMIEELAKHSNSCLMSRTLQLCVSSVLAK